MFKENDKSNFFARVLPLQLSLMHGSATKSLGCQTHRSSSSGHCACLESLTLYAKMLIRG